MIRMSFFVIGLLFLLVACGGQGPAPTGTPVSLDRSFATPVVGAVTVLTVPDAEGLDLRTHPEIRAFSLAVVKTGASGTLLGVDASGNWILVEIEGNTGWAPTQYFDYTIAQ